MPVTRLYACIGNAWPRPDDVDAIPTRRALPSNVELLGSAPTHTGAFALQGPSVAREPSSSLESQQAVGALHCPQSPLICKGPTCQPRARFVLLHPALCGRIAS